MSVIVVDFDGTLVENKWPEIGKWMPGAILAMLRLHTMGHHIILHSSRLSPFDLNGTERQPGEWMAEVQRVRAKLEEAGLGFIEIWTKPGKPHAHYYIDDRAERYPGTQKAWDKMVIRIAARERKSVVD